MADRWYYTVPAVRTVEGDLEVLTADVPAGVAWVGHPGSSRDTYLVKTDTELPPGRGTRRMPERPVIEEAERHDVPGGGRAPLDAWRIGGA